MNCGSAKNIETVRGLFYDDPKIVVPILSDVKAHWCLNRLSFAYIFNIRTHKELMLGFTHNDLHRFDFSVLGDFLHDNTYVYKKKYLYGLKNSNSCFDVEMLYWYNTNQRLTINVNQSVRRYWTEFREFNNVNDFIPIMKHLDHCREIKDKVLTQATNFDVTDSFRQYQKIADNLVEIERNGLFTQG